MDRGQPHVNLIADNGGIVLTADSGIKIETQTNSLYVTNTTVVQLKLLMSPQSRLKP